MPADIPSLRIHPADDSPQQPSTGGSSKEQSAPDTIGATDARTSRHVQFHSAAVTYDENRARKRHELDETATDPQAFSALSTALEEYSSDSRLQKMTNRSDPSSQPHDDHNALLSGEGFIDPDERAGLPSASSDAGAQSQVNLAASLVTAHTQRRKILPSLPALRLPGLSSKKVSTKTEREKILEHPSYGHDGTLDVESNPATIGRANNTLAGGGILSALLSLYDANDRDHSETSSLNSGLNTPLLHPKGKEMGTHSAPVSPNASLSHNTKGLLMGPEPTAKQSRGGLFGAIAAGRPATAIGGGEGADYFNFTPATPPGESVGTKPHYKSRWSEMLKDLPTPSFFAKEGTSTPVTDTDGESEVGRPMPDKRAEAKRRRSKRRKAEVFITRHISDVLARQTFICKLARCMMMHGGPTHRLQAQIVSTGRVLEVPLSCMYLPDVMLISFDDQATYTSSLQLIKQGSALDLAKLKRAYSTYWAVIHDQISVKDAAPQLDELMRSKSTYPTPALIVFGGGASAMICVTAFSGSFLDGVCCFALGMFLVFVQILTSRHELYSNMFEITMCTFISFVASALSQTEKLCYTAIASGSVVLILPGYIVLCGALELSSRNIVAGSVRLCYALIYALFLGFGLTIGLQIFQKMTSSTLLSDPNYVTDYSCARSHDQDLWYRATPVKWWYFLTVPGFALFLSLRNHAPWRRRELPLLVGIACVGWCSNYFSAKSFPNQTDVSAAIGGFAVGLVSNLYGRLFRGNAFVVMITGILFQLPSGLSNGGLFTSASQATIGNSSFYVSGFQTALQLVSTCIGLTVGLGISLVVVFPVQSRKRQAGVFSL